MWLSDTRYKQELRAAQCLEEEQPHLDEAFVEPIEGAEDVLPSFLARNK